MLRLIALAVALCLVSSAIRIGEEDRQTLGEYAKSHGLAYSDLPTLFGAVLRITCPWSQGAGVLVSDTGVVLTAEHLLFGPDADDEPFFKCYAESLFEISERMLFDQRNYVRGSDFRPDADRYERDVLLLKLRASRLKARPLNIAAPPDTPGDQFTVFAQGQINWRR